MQKQLKWKPHAKCDIVKGNISIKNEANMKHDLSGEKW